MYEFVFDEIGMVSARRGTRLIRSTQSPVFARNRQGELQAVAIKGGLVQTHVGEPAVAQFGGRSQAVPGHSRLAPQLNIQNHVFASEDLDLLVDVDMRYLERLQDVDGLVEKLIGLGLDPSSIVCFLDAGRAPGVRAAIAIDRLSRSGIGFGVSNVLLASDAMSCIESVGARYVQTNLRGISKLTGHVAGARLLSTFAATCAANGINVMIHGISTPEELRLAIDIGADLFEGSLLAPVKLTGCLIEKSPLSVSDLLETHSNVVPFRPRAIAAAHRY